jgi:5-oxopent-3-ene-1,2,5-tricarboxylate decarboxylase/2-hydroxyhepta-2,4-diene-1,7-dioate isomerase
LTREYRRILVDGNAVDVVRDGAELVAGDGRGSRSRTPSTCRR